MESDVMWNSEVSTSVISDDQMESVFVYTNWFRDVASPIPSWHRLRWRVVKFVQSRNSLLTILQTAEFSVWNFRSIFRYDIRLYI